MNRIKYIVFTLIFLTVVSAILIPKYLSSRNIRSVEDNTAKGVTLSKGSYRVGKDIKAGVYDFICISDKAEYFGHKFDKGERIVGSIIYENNQIDIDKGTFKLVPTSFKPLLVNSKGNYELIDNGTYTIGKEIPAGSYRIYVEGENSLHPVRVIASSDITNSDSEIASMSTEQKKEITVIVKNGNVIQIEFKYNLLGEEDTNIKVMLEPQ